MSEQKLISPLLDHFVMGPAISDHHGVCCCPAMTKDGSKRYIVKIISIPASQVQLEALLLAGAYSSKYAALAYYKDLSDGIAAEAEVLKKLSRFEGFVPYEDLQIVEMDDGKIGYQVYLLSPYKRSLERHMRKNPMTQLKAVNLGLDLCASMVMCRRAGYLYVDLKPGNIFINEKNEYCIGDLGFVRLDSLKYASLPDKYRSPYTAPELDDALSSLNETVDTYAIGMILYQIYNDGKLPKAGEPTPPVYADYEMAEIIMKAIDADPQQRWQDPMEMGQALVAYMQRNSVNDVPIIPLPEEPPVPAEPESEAPPEVPETPVTAVPEEAPAEPETPAEPEAPPVATEAPAAPPAEDPVPPEEPPVDPETDPEPAPETQSDPADLGFMDTLVQDDTAPGDDTVGAVPYADLSDETSDILTQADELLAMEIPEPVVAPEAIEVPLPPPIVLEDAEPEAPAAPAPVEAPPSEEAPPADEEPEEQPPAAPVVVPPVEPEAEAAPEAEEPPAPRKKGKVLKIVAAILVLALLLGAAAYGYHYYNNEYLQHIDNIEITGSEDTMTVRLTTDVDESLLQIVCADSYGNTIPGTVLDGICEFADLKPDTIYKVTVSISGFRELRGDTTATYTTPAQTKIVQFEATSGNDYGSAILTFTVEGKDTDNWTITYSAEGETERAQSFSGHILTVSDLAPGKTYTFRLSSSDPLYMVGTDTVTYSVSPLIFAENLAITQTSAEGLTAVWSTPAGGEGILWTVRCYSDSGYEQTLETTELTATFTGIDPTQAYTVEVTAQGMSTGVMTHISARSASITGSQADTSKPLTLTVTWTVEGDMPQGGWLVTYGVQGSGTTQTVLVTEPSVSIYPAMPDDVYNFTVAAADGITVFNNTFSYETGSVKVFSGYGVSAEKMSFNMCRTPDKANWAWTDLTNGSYTDTFKSGEKASFVVKLSGKYQKSDDYIDILFVVRDKTTKEIVCTSTTGASWTYLWNNGYCELDIPTMPTESGDYSIDIYFNGMAAARDFFSIQ